LLTDGKTETRVNAPLESNYIPRDESFDEVKKSGFLADSLKGKKHDVIADLFDPDKNFGTLREIYDLYAPPGEEAKMDTLVSNQNQPFQLLREFLVAPGEDNNIFKYPIPRVIESVYSDTSLNF
jgi:linoleate 9S-lipoxygenase